MLLDEPDHEAADRQQWPEYTTLQELQMELEHVETNYPSSTVRIKVLKIKVKEEELRLAKERQENSELHKVMQTMEDENTFLVDDVPY